MSNFRRPKHLTTRRMQETRPNPPKEQAKAQRPAREIRWNCPAAAKCGGCQLPRLSYAEQLQWKQQRVAELLDGICEVRPILGMDVRLRVFHLLTYFFTVLREVRAISAIALKPTRSVYNRMIVRNLFIFKGLLGIVSGFWFAFDSQANKIQLLLNL